MIGLLLVMVHCKQAKKESEEATTEPVIEEVSEEVEVVKFKMQTRNVSAIPELVKYFKKLKLKNPIVVSPDLGGKDRAKEFARQLELAKAPRTSGFGAHSVVRVGSCAMLSPNTRS